MIDKITCVFLSNTKDLNLYGMTQRAINTLKLSQPDTNFKIKIVETNTNYLSEGFVYQGCDVITPNETFNYNRFLNFGIKDLETDWVIISNNDVIFTQNWLTQIDKVYEQYPDIKSLSPWEPNWHIKRGMKPDKLFHLGYRTSFEITGWCIVLHKSVIEQCKLFDEKFEFWYQDNDYALSLQSKNIKHALVCNSRVYHMVSGSHHLLTSENKHNMTDGQSQNLFKKWGNNV